VAVQKAPAITCIDATTFQDPLLKIADVIAEKVKREAPKMISGPGFIAIDLHMLLRHSMYTFAFFCYLHAEDRRETDTAWRDAYTIIVLPLIRNMIDDLYNITLILEDLVQNGTWFRTSGYKKAFEALDADEKRYAGIKMWDEWIANNRKELDFVIRVDGFKVDQQLMATPTWPTMGKYINTLQKGGGTTPHQDFLKALLHGPWTQYSAMAHGAYQGLLPYAVYYSRDSLTHEDRDELDQRQPIIISQHFSRVALLLLCMVTELQAYFKFHDNGANINPRIRSLWDILIVAPEVQELYDKRYKQLMQDRGMFA
jgi:hypothetical protein